MRSTVEMVFGVLVSVAFGVAFIYAKDQVFKKKKW
jgi:preprotein translocase subunit SecE